MTLGDASGRSVVVTLWNDNAHSPLLDGAEGRTLQVRAGACGALLFPPPPSFDAPCTHSNPGNNTTPTPVQKI